MVESEQSDFLGHAALNIALPSRLANTSIKLLEQRSLQGVIRLEYHPDARLRATAERNDGKSISVTSCPVTNPTNSHCVLGLTWSVDKQALGILIDGDLIAMTKLDDVTVPANYVVAEKLSIAQPINFARNNEIAKTDRRQRLAGFQPMPRRRKASDEETFKALHTEVLQLRDLIPAVTNGALHHTIGLASRLRSLIAVGDKPMPLLQLCAAIIDEPLIVFITPTPFFTPVMAQFRPSSLGLSTDMSAKLTTRLTNPIDVDVWLGENAGNIKNKDFSHRELLTAIGHTRGSHIDQYLHPYVDMIQAMQTDLPTKGSDQMVNYLLKVGHAALALSQDLFHKRR